MNRTDDSGRLLTVDQRCFDLWDELPGAGALLVGLVDAAFALHRWVDSSRIVKTEDYGPHWRARYVRIQSRQDLGDESRGWLQESHGVVALQQGLAHRRPENDL